MPLSKADWRAAVNCQDASNLSGILHDLCEMSAAIWEDVHDPESPRNNFNRHPIVQLFVYKLMHLAMCEPIGEASCDKIAELFTKAYEECKREGDIE
jgi:hypothetical protein